MNVYLIKYYKSILVNSVGNRRRIDKYEYLEKKQIIPKVRSN
jgi:hypothetical protein